MRVLKITCVSLIIILITTFSYASVGVKNMVDSLDLNVTKKVYASSSEVKTNAEFYLIFNLSKIEYNEFKVKIINNSNAITSEVPIEAKNVSVASKETTFTVNKENISLDKIGVAYTAPSEESCLEFKIEITNSEDVLSKWKNEITTIETNLIELNESVDNLRENLKNINEMDNDAVTDTVTDEADKDDEESIVDTDSIKKEIEELEKTIEQNEVKKQELEEKIKSYTEETLEEVITVNVVENTQTNQFEENELKEKMEQEFEAREMSQMKKMMQEVENLEGNLQKAKNQISELTQTTTYQGSQNNYLSDLSIKGVNLKSDFSKTNLIYFAEVDNTVNSLTINATAEDSSSIVTIYGNTDLKIGKNKIMINVTAEDGSVKTYKIYVEKFEK